MQVCVWLLEVRLGGQGASGVVVFGFKSLPAWTSWGVLLRRTSWKAGFGIEVHLGGRGWLRDAGIAAAKTARPTHVCPPNLLARFRGTV